jgi:hypothetical protein
VNRSVRRLPALILAASVLTLLAACSPPVTNLAACAAPFSPGDNSNAVTATGKVGTEPKVDFPTPLVTKDAQVTVLDRGDGDMVYPSNAVEVLITGYDPTTGEATRSTGYTADSAIRGIAGSNAYLKFGECVPAGSRISVVATAQQIFGDGLADAISQGAATAADETQVYVIDVLDTYLGKANGWDQLPQAGMPSVVLAPDGQPGFIVPNETAPTDLRVALLKAGTGAAVAESDAVVLQYTGITWDGVSPFDSSWDTGPAVLTIDAQSVVPGFAQAIIGQKVGSQVLAVIPPDLGYGDTQQQSIPPGSTLVFVIDILKIQG